MPTPRHEHHHRRATLRGRGYFRRLGPGLVTGAADDDPSGIGTYSQVGAAQGFGLLWTAVLALPLASAVQEATARLGLVTGKGLAALIKQHCKRWVLLGAVGLVTLANTFNIGADIGAMAAATRLIVPVPAVVLVVGFTVLMAVLEVAVPYRTYSRVLRWLCLSLLAYFVVLFVVDVPWGDVARATFVPQFDLTRTEIAAIIAIFGTTVSPYLFFWQAAQEVEERHASAGLARPREAVRAHLRHIRVDTIVGMAFSNLIAFVIILSTAATLHASGITDIQTSAQAAEALRPIAGDATFLLFALGIVGTGLLAVPVLAGSAAYAVTEALGWRGSLDLKLGDGQGRGFYGVLAAATLGGLALCFTETDPVRELFWSAVLNGVVAVPIMATMMVLAGRREVMGEHVIGPWLKTLGWTATAVMAAVVGAMLATA